MISLQSYSENTSNAIPLYQMCTLLSQVLSGGKAMIRIASSARPFALERIVTFPGRSAMQMPTTTQVKVHHRLVQTNRCYLATGMKQRMSRAEGHPGDRNGVLPLAAQISRLLHVCSCPCCCLTMAKPGCHLLMTSVSLKPLLPCLDCPLLSLVAHASSAASPSEQITCKMDR